MNTIKYISILLIAMLLSIATNSQQDNTNSSGYIYDTEDFWNNIPVLSLSPESAATLLLSEVNNTDEIFFPKELATGENLFLNQEGNGSCASIATVFYTFSYEINRIRNVSGQLNENKYPPNFVWNFLNDGIYTQGSTFSGNMDILEEHGVANGLDWGNFDPTDYLRWMDGYEKYKNSHKNRIEGYEQIFNLADPDNIENLKHWIADHNQGGTAIGGLAVFASGGSCAPLVDLPPESAHSGDKALVNWSNGCNHAWTIVGYCDDIKWDFNEDGQYTNTIDINDDGIVNVFDWEVGAFNVAGKGDITNVNQGLLWIPFKTVAEMDVSGLSRVLVMHVDENYEPMIEVKVKIQHPKRDVYGHKVSWAEYANQTSPNPGAHSFVDNVFWFEGGEFPLHGIDQNPVELAYDFSYWFDNEDLGKIFFRPYELGSVYYNGNVEYMSIIDYRWNEEFELYSNMTNITIPHGSPQNTIFVDYDLIPHESYITSNLTFASNMVSRFNPTVSNNAILTIDDGVQIDMYDSELKITSGASLVIDDNVLFIAKKGSCKIVIDGNITIGDNVSFIAEDGAQLEVLLNNNLLVATFDNTTFESCKLNSFAENLTISNSVFDDCYYAVSHRGAINVSHTDFDRTWLYLENTEDNDNMASVSYCDFSTDYTMAAIDIWNYNQYDISNNTIDGYYNGIQILQSGYGQTKKQMISDNTITNCSQRGILAYGTMGNIHRNHISNNRYGVWFGDHSTIRLYGYSGAMSFPQTQEIRDNDSYEVYASQYSFPIYFRYNAIIDNDNSGAPYDPMVYHYANGVGLFKDVRYNCWGTGFLAGEDLYPGGYIWEPEWCPEFGGGIATEPDEDMYEVANNLFDAGDYTGAKSMYEMLIDQYPESKFAKAAIQELFALEKFISDDYNSLKQYYATNPTIQSDPELAETGDYMVSKCDIKLENWPDAISYYEGIILQPDNLEDSIFAIIDLGYVYFVMENSSYKSAYCGNLVQYKPQSKEQFNENRDHLLSLIPIHQMSGTMKENLAELKEGELLQNVPNPFKGSTQIWYKLEVESEIQLNVFNYTGQLVRTINEGTKSKGNHYVNFDAAGLKNGIYFCSIIINGRTTDSKKMTIMK